MSYKRVLAYLLTVALLLTNTTTIRWNDGSLEVVENGGNVITAAANTTETASGSAITGTTTASDSALNFTWSEVNNGVRIDGVSEQGETADELVIPNTIEDKDVVEIAAGAFKDCNQLTSISFEEENDYYVIDNGVIYSKDRSVLHSVTAAYPNQSFETPWDVVKVSAYAFANRDLPVLRIDNVQSIGANAFNGCTVTSMYFSHSVVEIAEGAFRGMDYLDMSISEVIGFSVESSNEYFVINNGMLMTTDGTRILIQIYKQDTTTEVNVPSGVTTIDDYAFEECPNLETIRIPASVTSIGEDTFGDNSNLTIITPKDSYAAQYAEENGYTLEEIDTEADAEGIKINATNFPDAVFRQAVSDSFDLDWNGVLSEEEIENATVLTKNNAGIESMEGIEYLTELVELNAYMNDMWTLDLSANTQLQSANISMQEPETGEIKGTIGDSATVILTEFVLDPFCNNNMLDYADEKGNGSLYIRVSLPDDLYGDASDVYWYSRRESCGIGSDMSIKDANGYRYYEVDTTDSREYIYAGVILDGEVNPEDIMPELSKLSEAYFVELVVLDYLEFTNGVLSSEPTVITKAYLKDMTTSVDYKVTNYYTVDFAQIVGEENVDNVVGVDDGTLKDGIATFIPVDYKVHEIRANLSATYWYDTGSGHTMGVKFSFDSLVSLDDCTEVPDGFADEFETVDDLKDHIHKDMHKNDNKKHKHQHMFDAKLWSVDDKCEWYNIAPEDFPAEGVEVFMPYPEGTDRDTDFKIAHVFEHDCNGYEKGYIEYPEITKEENGIRFRVMGLSPIMMAYGEEEAEEDAEETPTPGETPEETPTPNPTVKPVVPTIAPVPTATPEPTVAPAPTAAPQETPAPTYNPETSWTAPEVYAEESKKYDIFIGTSAEDAAMGRTMLKGETIDLNFYGVKNWTKDAYTYKWTTSDESIATVNNKGVVTMLDAGIAIIKLELVNKETGEVMNVAPIEVGVPAADYDVFIGTSAQDAELRRGLEIGKTVDLNFYGVKNWKKENYEYEWYSTDESIATVGPTGVVTAHAAGKAVIRLKLKDLRTGEYLVVAPVVLVVPEQTEAK